MRDFLRIKFGVPARRTSLMSQVSDASALSRLRTPPGPLVSGPTDAVAVKHFTSLQPALQRMITGASYKWHPRLASLVRILSSPGHGLDSFIHSLSSLFWGLADPSAL